MAVDRFLAWINVQVLVLQNEADKLTDGRKKHDIVVRIHELNEVRNSYHRITGENQ